jgi:spermidine synthase
MGQNIDNIPFETEAQAECFIRVADWIEELFGAFHFEAEDAPRFGVAVGSAVAYISVHPWGNDEVIVVTEARVATDVKTTPELMAWLLEENHELRFGAFSLAPDGTVVLRHSLLGNTLDQPEFKESVMSVLFAADKYDDEVVERWGGRRALDEVEG